MADLSEFQALTEAEELRRALSNTQAKLAKARAKTEELVTATVEGAKEAMLALGPVPALPKPRHDRRAGRPEVALWHLTDWQGSKLTSSYNSEVMRERVLRFCEKAEKLTEIQRAAYPVRDCTIMFGGDLIEGLFNFPQQPFQIDATLFRQYAQVGRLVVDVVRRALATYERVTVVHEWGNHGRIGAKRAAVPESDNFDRMIYWLAYEMLQAEKRLSWEFEQEHPEDIQHVEIGNYRALLIHGDEIGRNGFASRNTIVQAINRWRSGAHPWEFRDVYCVDPATEALTPRGWRRHDAIGELPIATMNPTTAAFEWQHPTRILTKHYEGELVHHHGRSLDHLATPDHDMWVRHHAGAWEKRKAAEVPASTNWLYRASADEWTGVLGEVDLPDRLADADPDDVAELIGWFIAEGHASPYQVSIAQDRIKKAANHQRILTLLSRLGFKVGSQPAYARVCNRELADWFREHCGHLAPNKQIPAFAKAWPASRLRRLLEAACLGDGSRTKNSVSGLTHYYTVSDQLAGDVQEVGLKLGMATMLRTRRPRGFGSLACHEVSLARSPVRRMATSRDTVPYEGLVWCPTVENGLWFMRRNGRVIVTGNCGHYHGHNEDSLANGLGSVFWTGSPESDNRYANDRMAASALPSQRLHFVDPDRGRVTAQYKVHLSD